MRLWCPFTLMFSITRDILVRTSCCSANAIPYCCFRAGSLFKLADDLEFVTSNQLLKSMTISATSGASLSFKIPSLTRYEMLLDMVLEISWAAGRTRILALELSSSRPSCNLSAARSWRLMTKLQISFYQ